MTTNDSVVHANGETFEKEVVKSDIPVLVDFWAPWCAPCLAIAPIIEDLSCDYSGKVKFVKVNVDEARNVAMSLGIMSIPTIAIFNQGKTTSQLIGVQGKAALEKMIHDSI